jgi:hypothetical protein
MKAKHWYRIEFIKASGNIGCDWRQFEDWEDAQGYAELMYGVNLWSITSNNQYND